MYSVYTRTIINKGIYLYIFLVLNLRGISVQSIPVTCSKTKEKKLKKKLLSNGDFDSTGKIFPKPSRVVKKKGDARNVNFQPKTRSQ